jgi:alpha-beta hydrolase superfamily lysophospholipase
MNAPEASEPTIMSPEPNRHWRLMGVHHVELSACGWSPSVAPDAMLGIVHGVGEHYGRYGRLIGALTHAGVEVCAFDQRGHGRSEGRRGHIDAWSNYRDDLATFVRSIREMSPGVPLFLYGHSMGALVVLDFVLHAPNMVDGVIASAPPFEPRGINAPWRIALAKLLSHVWPTFSVESRVPVEMLSREPAVHEACANDVLLHSRVTVRWGTEILRTIELVCKRANDIRVPIMLVHGGADPLVAADGTRDFFDGLTVDDRELYIYDDALHEPHNDLCWRELVRDVEQWIRRHVD